MTIPDDVRAQFRDEYLVCGIPARAAKAVGIAHSTGYKFAAELWKDPDFVKTWSELRAVDLPALRQVVVETAMALQDRIQEPDLSPDQLAALAKKYGLKGFSYQNPKPQYMRGLVSAYDTLSKPRDAAGEQIQTGPVFILNESREPEPPEPEPEAPGEAAAAAKSDAA